MDDWIDAGLVDRVLGEYLEMPGLALTIERARRLWGCDAVTSRRLADVLVERHIPAVVARWAPHSSGLVLRGCDEHLA